MSLSRDPTIRNLNDCGCCAGDDIQAPAAIDNRPGLSAVAYRVGTHSRFKASMLARLSAADLPALHNLTTRADGDFTVALLDAWASIADVLSFYQERIANESYLRTATERRSLAELARLVGYLPRPGVAASAYLAFTFDDTSTSDVPVPLGTRVQSIPEPGETPQVFETIEAITGRSEWNAMKPLLAQKHPNLQADTEAVTVRGMAPNVRQGDSILLVYGASGEKRDVKRVVGVVPDTVAQTTRLDIETVPVNPDPPEFKFIYRDAMDWTGGPTKLTTTSVATNVMRGWWKQGDLKAYAAVQGWSIKKLSLNIRAQVKLALKQTPAQGRVFAFRQRASIFGHNAPKWTTLPEPKPGSDWESLTLKTVANASKNHIDLDTTYPGIVDGSWLVLRNENNEIGVHQVQGYAELTRADYTLSAKVSRITLDSNADFDQFGLRTTTVLVQSEQLELAELPIAEDIQGNRLLLDRIYLGLQVGRPVVVTGRCNDLAGVTDSEVMILADVLFNEGYTELVFHDNLANRYERSSVTVNANVALATHGETKSQPLGSGDATTPFQTFALPESPLTYVAAQNAKGAASTLQVRVNQLLWQEVDTFYGHGPDEQIYVTRTDDEGRNTVQFGDGRTGARVPTGQENVGVTYRKGMGAEGVVDESQLTLLLTKPLGVRGVTNPVAARDAADRESRDDVRRNAALPIRTLDRIVSLRDYEDFARAFTGVAKAQATWTWNGYQRGVFVTVAATGGKAIADGSLTHTHLLAAICQAGDNTVPLRVKSYRPAFFRLSSRLSIDPTYRQDQVLLAVEAGLRSAFSFDAREFGQPVAKSEVIAVIQAVKGVLAVDLNELYRTGGGATLADRLTADVPRAGTDVTVAAELLLLDPRPLQLGVMNA